MTDLSRALWAEALKLKRTLALRLAVGTPLVIVLIVFGAYVQRGSRGQDGLIGQAQLSLTLWTILLLPVYAALVAALLASVEHETDNWKHLFALPIDRRAVFFAKFAAAFALVMTSFGTLIVGVSMAASAIRVWTPGLHGAASPLPFITTRGIQSCLAAGLMLSIQVWVSLRWRTFLAGISLAAGAIVLMVALVPHGVTLIAYAFPWALPVTAMAPHSLHRGVAIAIGTGGGLLLAALACADLARREFLP